MGKLVCEILPEDLDAGHQVPAEPLRLQSPTTLRVLPRLRPRLLIVSPALIGINQPTLDANLVAELNDQGFAVLRLNPFKKILGHVVHRLNIALQGGEIVVRDQRIPAAAGSPLAFHLPLSAGGWSIYETTQTLTLRYAPCGFVSWPVRTPAEVDNMLTAIDKLMPQRPLQIHHAGPVSRQTEQIGKLVLRPVLFGALTKFPDLKLELFTRRGWTGAASDGLAASNKLWGFGVGWGRRFVGSGAGISLIVFAVALFSVWGLKVDPPKAITQPELRTAARDGDSGAVYWEVANVIGAEIRRAGIAQIQELKIRVDEIRSSQEFVVSMRWLIAPSPLLRAADQKGQGLIQTQLQQSLSKMPGIEAIDIDLTKNIIATKLRPIAATQNTGAPDLAQWMGGLKKTHAVLIETKSQSGPRVSFRAPDQPISNLIAFATAMSRHPGLREMAIRAGSPGIGSLEFDMELSR